MRDVYIIGVGTTKFGELWDKSLRDLATEAGLKAITDAGIYSEDVNALYGANTSAGQFIDQEHIASLIADAAGLSELGIPSIRIEAGSASGGAALHEAYLAVASGKYDTVVVGGVEKMTDVPPEEANKIVGGSLDAEWETFFGVTEASLAAMIAKRLEYEGKMKREDYAHIPVVSHKHGSMNETSHFRNSIKLEDVLKASYVAQPLTIFDCAPLSDGASAIVISSNRQLINSSENPVKIVSSEISTDYLSLHDRTSIYSLNAFKRSSKKALESAKISKEKVDILELHDSYSIIGLLQLMELYGEKEAMSLVRNEELYWDKSRPTNTSGGLKAHGNPLGATGIYQAVEATLQLRGKAGQRQVKGAKYVLLHNMGGIGATSVSTVLGVE